MKALKAYFFLLKSNQNEYRAYVYPPRVLAPQHSCTVIYGRKIHYLFSLSLTIQCRHLFLMNKVRMWVEMDEIYCELWS